MAAIKAVYTLAAVAPMLGVSEEFLHDLSIEMELEDGCLSVYGPGDEYTPAFTPRESSACASLSQSSPSLIFPSAWPDRGPHRMLTAFWGGSTNDWPG